MVPGELRTTKGGELRGGEVIEASRWVIVGTSRESPDAARSDLAKKAGMLAANGIILVQYYKSTGSERGTGRGTHYFTIHNFVGTPAMLGRPSASGAVTRDELLGLDQRAAALKAELVAKTSASANTALITGLVIGGLVGLTVAIINFAFGVVAATAIFLIVYLLMATNYDRWLVRP